MFEKALAVFFSIVLTVLTFGGRLSIPLYEIRLRLVPASERQTITGFGASGCWWSQKAKSETARAEILRTLFGMDGLALNIYRYNVGGGVNPAHNRVKNDWRCAESFLVQDPKTGEWVFDFTRDALAQKTMFEALALGCVDTVVLFANSPHYSMTVSGEASGSEQPGVCNLAEDQYEAFADYFLTITEYFLSKGVPVKYISPVNEPQWKWGGDGVTQEGCHYEPEQLARLFHIFAEKLGARGLSVLLAAPESGEGGAGADPYFTALAEDPLILRHIGSFCYHSYWMDDNAAEKQAFGAWYREQSYADRSFDMTEWCELPCAHTTDDPAAAALTARVIANDLRFSGVNSWSAWVGVNEGDGPRNYSDGLFWASKDFSAWGQAYRSYALGHFSRFVPPGSKMIDYVLTPYQLNKNETDSKTLQFAAFKTPAGDLVLVAANESVPVRLRLAQSGGAMEVYTTDTAHRLEQTYAGAVQRALTLPAVSVTTIVIHP